MSVGRNNKDSRFKARKRLSKNTIPDCFPTTLEMSIPDVTVSKQTPGYASSNFIATEGSAMLSEQTHDQFQSLQVLLVGCKGNGKSHTGNTILGQEAFRVSRKGGTQMASLSSSSHHQVDGVTREVTVVDTPGVSQEMTESEFEELVQAVKMVPEGFDAICLVWDYDNSERFEEKEVQVFQSLHRLFGDELYEHLVILVTHAQQEDIPEFIEELPDNMKKIADNGHYRITHMEHINEAGANQAAVVEHEQQALSRYQNDPTDFDQTKEKRRTSSKCRFHEKIIAMDNNCKLNSKDSAASEQLKLFLSLIQELSNESGKRYTASDLSPSCQIPSGENLCLVLLGKTGVGKSNTGNSIIGQNVFSVSDRALSETQHCDSGSRQVGRRSIMVVDTPSLVQGTVEEKNKIVTEIKEETKTNALYALIMIITLGRFSRSDVEMAGRYCNIFGEIFWNCSVVLLTGKDKLTCNEKDYLTYAPKDLTDMLVKCGGRYVFFDNMTRDETLRRMQLVRLINLVENIAIDDFSSHIDSDSSENSPLLGHAGHTSAALPIKRQVSDMPLCSIVCCIVFCMLFAMLLYWLAKSAEV